ncbi:hypothetical protein LJB85_03000 [Porphyromonadaceae bacterium OttesenSCG-928-L07]|nr:hypothetical protein [Porphyromonadaceae bacterium OttesenSCG-928-L07]MDL2251962.1 hypothetical protein [Odoribacter sp. OttesenSCG-928-J03]
MKINVFLLVVSLLLCGLIFYAFYASCGGNLLYSIGSACVAAITLVPTMSMAIKGAPRSTTVIKVVSGIFGPVMLVMNILFAISHISTSVFIIINGVLLCIWAIIVYSIGKTKQ